MKKPSNSHRFALYCNELSDLVMKAQNNRLSFKNKELFNRMINILRMRAGEIVVLFDQNMQISIMLDAEMFKDRNEIMGNFSGVISHIPIEPKLTLAIGITKKEAFLEITYLACQMGVTQIIPLITDKVQREWGGAKEEQKLFTTMVAAAEQSKNFIFPTIAQPQTLQSLIQNYSDPKTGRAYFEPNGNSFFELLQSIHKKTYNEVIIVIGPEGGLTTQEQEGLSKNGFEKYQLTPTILRSIEAVAVAVGAIRSSA